MGDAKRRKQSDPLFGRVPQSAMSRGLVVSPPIKIEGSSLYVKSSNLDPQELRFALLFWDRLVWPTSRNFTFPTGPDELFLETAGILSRPDYTIDGDQAQAIARGQIKAFLDLDRLEPGVWAMAQGENSLLLEDTHFEVGRGAIVELHRAIPIPTTDVPFNEILEFKEKRHDELIVLRYQLNTFVLEIEKAEDKQLELQKRITELDEACANLLIVAKEWQFPVYLSDMKTAVNLSPMSLIKGALGGWGAGEYFGLDSASKAVMSVAGLAVSTMEIKFDKIGYRSVNRPQSPYQYSYQIHKELI